MPTPSTPPPSGRSSRSCSPMRTTTVERSRSTPPASCSSGWATAAPAVTPRIAPRTAGSCWARSCAWTWTRAAPRRTPSLTTIRSWTDRTARDRSPGHAQPVAAVDRPRDGRPVDRRRRAGRHRGDRRRAERAAGPGLRVEHARGDRVLQAQGRLRHAGQDDAGRGVHARLRVHRHRRLRVSRDGPSIAHRHLRLRGLLLGDDVGHRCRRSGHAGGRQRDGPHGGLVRRGRGGRGLSRRSRIRRRSCGSRPATDLRPRIRSPVR